MKIPHLDPSYAKQRRAQWPRAFRLGLIFLAVIWGFFLLAQVLPLTQFGTKPRTIEGLLGIVTMPFIHSGWPHLVGNSLPMFVAVLALFGNYPKVAKMIVLLSIVLTGTLVWVFGREVNHIGSSGLFYALLSYLFVSGFLKKDIQSIGISIAIAFMYGSMIWGIFPGKPGVSWESHMFGFLVGVFLAYNTKDIDRPVLKDWQLDKDLDQYYEE
ncbi:rhomboid family intramembrane serine protease [Marinicella sp. S1101]|uniref:rhomboid family intramembrane serine protease n=1 Tax=Marinicella marina TaxID=2996016 RepID=UPI00226103A6|nr:rhomboid family intramembrane serine protease [Marinicella marina]MCX7554226.1 rhomboid family intramembrane serine protease [Marinicella marina]MDJ1138781.1 rhomboid family intramembrane serine protease [Marinicella marina]